MNKRRLRPIVTYQKWYPAHFIIGGVYTCITDYVNEPKGK